MGGGVGGVGGAAQVAGAMTNNYYYPGSQGAKQNIMYMWVHLTNGSALKDSTEEDLLWKIVRWLSDIDFDDTQADIFVKHTKGTGQWLFESQQFKDWADGKFRILWCCGDREHLPFHQRLVNLSLV
jgi:hypothetical protein